MDFERMLQYCAALELHNDRAWFHENHRAYEQARADFIALLDILRFTVADAAPALAPDIKYMEARDWMYRVARDMRYYHDRPPYDPAFRAYISRDRKSWLPIGYFLRIAPGASRFGTGIWCENTASTNLVRDHIRENAARFGALAKKCPIPLSGDRLKKMPRGYDELDPAADWIKYKNWELIAAIPDGELTTTENLQRTVARLVSEMEPLRLFFLEGATRRRTEKQAMTDFYCR